ncbi:MAG: hypothetical protein J6U36_02700 [Oscillospiraceae bacterium]|nr:hypothetical protein [Oscillospiraceae bacterium]
MKRGLSLITSLMMTASVFGGAASQAIGSNTIAVVSAAEAKPVMNIGDAVYAGTTKVPVGTKKVSIPVKVTSTDLLAMTVKVEVKADKAGAADPVITGFSEELASVTPDEAASNARSFIWTSSDGIKAPELKDTAIANVEITLPDDAKEDSTYTLTVKSIDPSDLAKTEGYAFDEKSDLTEKIAFGTPTAEDYTLKFAEGADGKWTEAETIKVKAGDVVPVGLEIQCPSNAIGAIVFGYDLTAKAEIKSFEKGKIGEVDAGEDTNLKAVWTIPGEFKGYTFKEETHLYTINVAIPEDAKAGDKFTLSMKSEDTSTADRVSISPVKLPAVDLVVDDGTPVEEKTLDLTIDTIKVDIADENRTFELPVYAKGGSATAIVAAFEAQKGAKITGIKEAAVPGDVLSSEDGSKATWNNEFKGKVSDYTFGDEDSKLFILTVELPAEITETEYPVVFKGDVDVADAARNTVKPVLKDGAIIINSYVTPAETEPVTTPVETVADTTVETTPVSTASETTPVSTASETTPVSTEAGTTPVSTASETTPVSTASETTIETTAPVTTAITTTTTEVTTIGEIQINLTVTDVSEFEKIIGVQVFPEEYKPEFYYEHEKEFNKLAEDFGASVKLEAEVQGKDGKKTPTEFNFKLTKDNVVLPTSEETNPGKVYNEKNFKYNVPVKISFDNFKPEDIIGADGKALNAEVAQKFIDELKAKNITVDMPVMIGLLGDFDLSHSVLQTDATYILREQLATQVDNKSIIEDTVLADRAEAKEELGKYTVDFAKFLGDTDMDGEGKQVDATFILRAILERDFAKTDDKNRISEEIWKTVGVIK